MLSQLFQISPLIFVCCCQFWLDCWRIAFANKLFRGVTLSIVKSVSSFLTDWHLSYVKMKLQFVIWGKLQSNLYIEYIDIIY